jgi:glycosyltransferase involved in cell wall biosynthesis
MNPKVSLIMTVYNREQYLEEAIAFVGLACECDREFGLWEAIVGVWV